MNLGLVAILAVGIVGVLAAGCRAETVRPSPKAILESDTAVREAGLNIAKMDYTELSLLAHYLGECSEALSKEPLIHHLCWAARLRYRIEYGADRPIDRLIHALMVAAELLSNDTTNQHKDLMLRYIEVGNLVEMFVGVRFAELRRAAATGESHP